MTVFILIESGYFGTEILGVFSSKEEAEIAKDACRREDLFYVVREFRLGELRSRYPGVF